MQGGVYGGGHGPCMATGWGGLLYYQSALNFYLSGLLPVSTMLLLVSTAILLGSALTP